MKPNLLVLVAVVLPPRALQGLGDFVEERTVDTTYGAIGPVALRVMGDGTPVWVQPYSGLPTRTDPRATILAARTLGVTHILNWDAGIAVNPLLRRGQPVIPLDYIDWTRHQPTTFSDDQMGNLAPGPGFAVRHPSFSPQLTAALSALLPMAPGVVYLGTEGPRRETPAEARMIRSWGVDVMGQNLVPEVALAQEMDLSFAGLVTVIDHSTDQSTATPTGEVRDGLELVCRALPEFVRFLASQ